MKIRFNIHFHQDLLGIPANVAHRVEQIIQRLEVAHDLRGVAQLKMLTGHRRCYRIRIGDYRLGIRLVQGEVRLERFIKRSDFYRYFP